MGTREFKHDTNCAELKKKMRIDDDSDEKDEQVQVGSSRCRISIRVDVHLFH